MTSSISKVSSKSQIVIPAWVRKKLDIKPNTEIVWIEMKPGDISIVAREPMEGEEWIKNICGIIQDDSFDSLEELKKYKIEDKKQEMRGFNN